LGLGLAEAFLKAECKVMVNGRIEAAVDKTLTRLHAKYGHGRVLGCAADVTQASQVQRLWDAAATRFGAVDIWINNAGLSHLYQPLWLIPTDTVAHVLATNVLGTIHGSHVAAQGMLAQGGGQIYNVEGVQALGSHPHATTYGTTQAALHYFTRALAADAQGTPLIVGAISPGLVVTELWAAQYAGQPEQWEQAKQQINRLGDRVETVAPYLAEKILANARNGAHIAWLTPLKIFTRTLQAAFTKRDLFGESALHA
jgi:NAD(P)-dependent dehydrogenase (short-subunit alcohol dehydrogenase family)